MGVEARIRDIITARKEVRVLLPVVTIFSVRHLGKGHNFGLLCYSLLTRTTSGCRKLLLLKIELPGRLGLWHDLRFFFNILLNGALLLARG